MNILQKQIELIERIDQLIRLKATGSPKELAEKLKISESTVYRTIETKKELGAPVIYDINCQSYKYTSRVKFHCGYLNRELKEEESKKIYGGFNHLSFLVKYFFSTVRI
jgi:predicted DNA-binding transcriptional regulator YafY